MDTLKIAVVGAGIIGKRHMQLIRENPQTRLCAVIDPAPVAAEIAAVEGVPYFDSLDDFFAASLNADGIILATPNGLHVTGALACLQHQIPALIEKPVADTLNAADQLVAAAEQSAVRDTIASGCLGHVVNFTGTALFYKPDSYYAAGAWRTVAGGGPILIDLIHEIDALRFMLGEIVSVQAMTSNAVREFEVEDSVAILFRFASGTLGTFMLSDTAAAPRSWEQTSGEDKVYPAHPGEDCYFITGTDGSIAVPTMRMWTYQGERSWWNPFVCTTAGIKEADPMASQLTHFCEVVRGRTQPRSTVRDATQSLRVTLAVASAAKTNASVHLAMQSVYAPAV